MLLLFPIKELSTRITSFCQQISWSQWESASKEVSAEVDHVITYCNIEKKKKRGSLDDVLNEFYENLAEFLDHQYVKMKQSQSSADIISEALKPGSLKAVVICDFAEKFHCFYQTSRNQQTLAKLLSAFLRPLFIIANYHQL